MKVWRTVMNKLEYDLGDIIEMKKEHPCHKSKEWKIIRMGADIRIKCQGCQTSVMMPRQEFDRKIKKVVRRAADQPNQEE